MTFDEKSISHIIRSLTNMYSDPYTAIAREYSANAYDSHIMANQSRPIEITTPHALNPNLIIRDFGVGMSRDELVEIYSKYGASTKRNTNDQIGAFGLGAKSALALVSSFTVVSVQNGKKNTVIVSKDTTGVGGLNFFAETETTDENGVTVTIPIPEAARMERAFRGLFLGWPLGTVKVNGELVTDTVHNPENYLPIPNAGYMNVSAPEASEDNYWRRDSSITALVGPVKYTIDRYAFNQILSEAFGDDKESIQAFKESLFSLVFALPNGSVELTPSREELIYSSATKSAIITAYKAMLAGVGVELNAKIAKLSTRKEVLEAVKSFYANGFRIPLKWNGETIEAERVMLNAAGVTAAVTATHKMKDIKAASHNVNNEYGYLLTSVFYRYETATRVIVTDAANDVIPSTDHKLGTVHSVAKNIAAYLKSEAFKKLAGSAHNIEIVTTSLSQDKLNPWAIALADVVVTADELMEAARQQRREAAAKRALEAKKAAKPVAVTVPIAVKAHDVSSWRSSAYKSRVTDISTLPADAKFAVLQEAGEPSVYRKPQALADTLYLYLRGDSSNRHYGNVISTAGITNIVSLFVNSGYTVVSLPKGRNLANTLSKLPNYVMLEEELPKLVAETVNSLTEVEKDWIATFAKSNRNSLNWATEFETDDLPLIESDETRAWISIGVSTKGEVLKALIGLAKDNSGDAEKHIEATWGHNAIIASSLKKVLPVTANKPVRSYPLLESLSFTAKAKDIAEYVNLKDAARK